MNKFFILLYFTLLNTQENLLIFVNQDVCSASNSFDLKNLNFIKVNEVSDIQFLDHQQIENIVSLAERELEVTFIEDGLKQELLLGDKDLISLNIPELDENPIFFVSDDFENYQAYLISDDMYKLIFQDNQDLELDKIADAIGDEKVALPKIPLPPAVTAVIAKAGIKIILAYYHVKDFIFGKV